MTPEHARPLSIGVPAVRSDAPYARFASACVVTYLLLALPVAAYVADLLNHDAVSYLSLAKHWLAGRADLAVSGTWSPLFAWLLAALLAVTGGQALLSLRLAMLISGAVFLLACLAIYAAVEDVRLARFAGALTAAFAALFTGTLATPDLLSAGVFLYGFHLYVARGQFGEARAAVGAGTLFGLAYLAKAVLLPVALGSVLLLAALRAWALRGSRGAARQSGNRRAARGAAFALTALALVATPWVAALSARYGEFTLTRANVPQWGFIGPVNRMEGQPTSMRFIVPESGRQSQFEDESIVADPPWSPFESRAYFAHYVKHVRDNVARVPTTLSRFDLTGAGLLGLVFCLALGLRYARAARRDPPVSDWTALALPTLLLIAAYLPNFADQMRYYLVATPALYLGALHGWQAATATVVGRPGPTGAWLGAGALAASLVAIPPQMLPHERESEPIRQSRAVAAALRESGIRGPVAVAGSPLETHPGIYLSLFLGTPYHGTQRVKSLAEVDAACAPLLIVARGSERERLLVGAGDRFRDARTLSPALAAALRDTPFALYVDRRPVTGRTGCFVARAP
jgi:hypothetical protein